jgi:hypothetical protein
MVLSSKDFQSAMYVRLDGPDRLTQRLGHLGVRKVLDMSQHDGLAISRGKAGDARRQLVDLGFP